MATRRASLYATVVSGLEEAGFTLLQFSERLYDTEHGIHLSFYFTVITSPWKVKWRFQISTNFQFSRKTRLNCNAT